MTTLRRAAGPVALAAALLAGAGACTEPAADGTPGTPQTEPVAGAPQAEGARTFIVGVRGDAEPDAVADERGRRGSLFVRWRGRSALRGFVASMSENEARDLATDERVEFVEPDFEVTTAAQTLPTGIARVGATANSTLRLNATADGAVDADVAVLDSGVDLDHPDLNVGPGVTCIGGTCRAGGDDDNGHGTHVAGTIGAKDDGNGVVGVAPGARIVPVKALDSRGSGPMSQVIAGLDWVAANSGRIDVVNMSLGGVGTSRAMDNAVANLVNRGVVVIVAAGNSNRDARVISPANNSDVITVSAVADYDGRPGGGGRPASGCRSQGGDDQKASFSNYGSVVDVAAPGVCVLSLRPGGGTAVMSGTSMASPHVAGAAALLVSRTKPRDRGGVLAVRQALVSAGTSDWNDTSRDGIREPLMNVSNAGTYNAVLTGGPVTPPTTPGPTTPGPTTPGPTTPTTTSPPSVPLSLSATGSSVWGFRVATLSWSGAGGGQVTVYRNGAAVITTADTGTYRDLAGYFVRSATYRVCVAGTSRCSNEVTVSF